MRTGGHLVHAMLQGAYRFNVNMRHETTFTGSTTNIENKPRIRQCPSDFAYDEQLATYFIGHPIASSARFSVQFRTLTPYKSSSYDSF